MSAEPIERWRLRLHETFGLAAAVSSGELPHARRERLRARAEWWRERMRKRDRLFGAELFAEPGFDLLLDLYLAPEAGACQVDDRVLASARWRYVAAMEQRDLIERERAGDDPRRMRVRLTAEARAAMERFLDGEQPV